MTIDASFLTDVEWIDDVMSRLLALDEGLGDADVRPFVTELALRPEWRALSPEDAAAKAKAETEPPEGH